MNIRRVIDADDRTPFLGIMRCQNDCTLSTNPRTEYRAPWRTFYSRFWITMIYEESVTRTLGKEYPAHLGTGCECTHGGSSLWGPVSVEMCVRKDEVLLLSRAIRRGVWSVGV